MAEITMREHMVKDAHLGWPCCIRGSAHSKGLGRVIGQALT